jgi:hypothetical protein
MQIQGSDNQKLKRNFKTAKNQFFSIKNAIFFLGLHKGRPSYRRSLKPSKENIKHFKT